MSFTMLFTIVVDCIVNALKKSSVSYLLHILLIVFSDEIHNAETDKTMLTAKIEALEGLYLLTM